MVDIIFFALLAAFLIYRLHSVLGRKDLNDTVKTRNMSGTLDALSGKFKKASGKPEESSVYQQDFKDKISEPEITDEKILAGIDAIKKIDRSFSAGSFLGGAKVAFEMVINAFSGNDKDTLKNLLSNELYLEFANEIAARNEPGRKYETTLVGLLSNDITAAKLSGKNAEITVKFVSEQIDVVRNDKGEIIEGNSSQIVTVKDIWAFSRDLTSSNPNWTLVDTSGRE